MAEDMRCCTPITEHQIQIKHLKRVVWVRDSSRRDECMEQTATAVRL